MRVVAIGFAALLLSACHAEEDTSGDMLIDHGNGTMTAVKRSPTQSTVFGFNPAQAVRQASDRNQSRIVDLTGTLDASELTVLARQLTRTQKALGTRIMVVLVRPGTEQSLEQVGWAVGSGSAAARTLMILVDPRDRQVRVEGNLVPERKAEVAAAMQPALHAGRVALAVESGLRRLERVAAS